MIRINQNDILNIAFVYNFLYNNSTVLMKITADNYIKQFYNTLKELKIDYQYDYLSNVEYVYDYIKDKDNNEYYIIKYDNWDDIVKYTDFGCYPYDLVTVAENESLLNILKIEQHQNSNVQKVYNRMKVSD